MTDDELDRLLQPPDPQVLASGRTDRLNRSATVIARRRLWRSAGWLTLSAAMAIGGLVAGRATSPNDVRVERVIIGRDEPAVADPSPSAAIPIEAPPETGAGVELAAEQIDDRTQRAIRYRLAGDLYLNVDGDHQSALRCYRVFLEECSPESRSPSASDTWLLAQLKRIETYGGAQ